MKRSGYWAMLAGSATNFAAKALLDGRDGVFVLCIGIAAMCLWRYSVNDRAGR